MICAHRKPQKWAYSENKLFMKTLPELFHYLYHLIFILI